MNENLTYMQFVVKHNELLCDSLRPRMPFETTGQWLRARTKAQNELQALEEKHPEFYKKYKMP